MENSVNLDFEKIVKVNNLRLNFYGKDAEHLLEILDSLSGVIQSKIDLGYFTEPSKEAQQFYRCLMCELNLKRE